MNTFDEFVLMAKDAAGAAARKTGEVVEISKLNLQALRLNGNIRKAYEELGSHYYNSVKYGPAGEEQLRTCVEEIDRLLDEQEKLNAAIDRMGKKETNSLFCASCGFANAPSSAFCAHCGKPLGVSAAEAQVLSENDPEVTREN